MLFSLDVSAVFFIIIYLWKGVFTPCMHNAFMRKRAYHAAQRRQKRKNTQQTYRQAKEYTITYYTLLLLQLYKKDVCKLPNLFFQGIYIYYTVQNHIAETNETNNRRKISIKQQ